MVVVGVDSATPDAVVGVTADGEVVRESRVDPGADGRPRHSQVLLAEIERSVDAAGGWERIERIAVGVGPGSFTGLRIGIATARALAQARDLPIAAVGTLNATGSGDLRRSEGSGSSGAARDRRPPRRGLRRSDRGGRRGALATVRHAAGSAGGASAELGHAPLAAGDGALRFAAELEAAGAAVAPPEDPIHRLAARHVCSIGEAAVEVSPDRIQPLYLRPPDAKRWLERDRSDPGG